MNRGPPNRPTKPLRTERRLFQNNNNEGAGGGAAAAAPPPPPPSIIPYENISDPPFYIFEKCMEIGNKFYHLVRPNGNINAVNTNALPVEKYNSIAELLEHPGTYTWILFADNEFRAAKALTPGEILSKHKNLHRNSGDKPIKMAGEIRVNPDKSVTYNFISGTYMRPILERFRNRFPHANPLPLYSNAFNQLLADAGATGIEVDQRLTEEATMIDRVTTEEAIAPYLAMDPPYTRHGPYDTAADCMAARDAAGMQGGGSVPKAVAVFAAGPVQGEAVAEAAGEDTILKVRFTKLPAGEHGFHIHRSGDLRGSVKNGKFRFSLMGCKGACDHWQKGRPCSHGPAPGKSRRQRHTGDLGNVNMRRPRRKYTLKNVQPQELFGRTLIVHADPDDLGLGPHEDSKTTGHSGARIACSIFGRA